MHTEQDKLTSPVTAMLGNGELLEWYPEDFTISQFLVEMWRWTLAEA
jgi:hypothetical protein